MEGVRRHALLYLLFGILLVPTAAPPARADLHQRAADDTAFRLFSMGYMQRMANAQSYETWIDSIEERVEQIRPLLSSRHPDVVVFPESITLTAWLIGPRGEQARRDGNSSLSAVASLAATYAPQVSYYETKCQVPAPRALVLALTDT
ncbi:MAG: hypothetical protein LC808_42890, partial [Actinobacteria bacterium]|nr:hypothetical protein [Actinomycetota bacterium]